MDSGIIVVIVFTLFVVIAVTWLELSSRRKKGAQPNGAQANAAATQANTSTKRAESARRARHNK